jgi:hypothetical protein
MTRIFWVVGLWLVAVAAIAAAFATERLQWPELWLWPVTLLATCIACSLAPQYRWRWLIASPLIGVFACALISMTVLGGLAHHSHAQAEAWLQGQFSGAALPDPDQKPALYDIAARHAGLGEVDCYDNVPFATLGWECRATFRDGTALTFDAWATWSRRFAVTDGQVDGSRTARVASPAGWVEAYVEEWRTGPSNGNTQVMLSFDNDRCGSGAVSAQGRNLGLQLRWIDPTTLEVTHPDNVVMSRNASGEYLQCGPRKVHVLLTARNPVLETDHR